MGTFWRPAVLAIVALTVASPHFVGVAQPGATAAVSQVEAQEEVAAALYSASATQAAIQRAADEQILGLRDEIEELRLQVARGATEATAETLALRQELTDKSERFVAALEARDRAYAQEIAIFREAVSYTHLTLPTTPYV